MAHEVIAKCVTDIAFFYFKICKHNAKAGLCSLWRTRKKPFDVIYYLYKIKESHWLLCVANNCDWSTKITPLSNIRTGKQSYVFILTDFKKCCFDVSFLTSISMSMVILGLGKVEFLNKLISETFLFIGFLNSR